MTRASGEDRGTSCAVGQVVPVGEALGHHPQSGPLGELGQHGPGWAEHGQFRVVVADRGDQRRRLRLVPGGGVVERAVRLEVADPGAVRPAERVERAELVEHLVAQFREVVRDVPPAEAGEVPVAHLGADGDLPLRGGGADPAHGGRVAGVEAAGDVGRGDQVQQRLVVAEPPGTESLTEISVEVHGT